MIDIFEWLADVFANGRFRLGILAYYLFKVGRFGQRLK